MPCAAASIASLMIEKYLFGATKRPWIEQYVLIGNFEDVKVKPEEVDDVKLEGVKN